MATRDFRTPRSRSGTQSITNQSCSRTETPVLEMATGMQSNGTEAKSTERDNRNEVVLKRSAFCQRLGWQKQASGCVGECRMAFGCFFFSRMPLQSMQERGPLNIAVFVSAAVIVLLGCTQLGQSGDGSVLASAWVRRHFVNRCVT